MTAKPTQPIEPLKGIEESQSFKPKEKMRTRPGLEVASPSTEKRGIERGIEEAVVSTLEIEKGEYE